MELDEELDELEEFPISLELMLAEDLSLADESAASAPSAPEDPIKATMATTNMAYRKLVLRYFILVAIDR